MPQNESKELTEALRSGNVPEARRLVREGADLYSRPLALVHAALLSGKQETLVFLKSVGIDIATLEYWDYHYLLSAAQSGNIELFELIRRLNERLFPGVTLPPGVLIPGISSKSLAMVKHLFSLGLDAHARGAGYNFSIYEAACRGDLEMVRFLIDHRAAPGTGIVFRMTELDPQDNLSPDADSTDAIPLLLETGIINEDQFTTLFHFSIHWGQLNLAKYYVEHGHLDICKKTPFLGATPLHLAILALKNVNSIELIKYFVEQGADILALDDNLETPVQLAIASGNFELVHYFLQKGVDIVSLAESGNQYVVKDFIEPSFEDASPSAEDLDEMDNDLEDMEFDSEDEYFQQTSIQSFLSSLPPSTPNSLNMEELAFNLNSFFDGAEILLRNPQPRTALHCAVESGNPQMVQYVLDMEMVDIDARNRDGNTPLLHCLQNGKPDNRLEIVKMLINRGADFNARNRQGMFPLNLALANEQPEVVEYLLTLPIEIDRIGPCGETMLHWAARFGNLKLAERCLIADIPVDAEDNDGDTPLFEASSKEMVLFLLKNGADPLAVNNRNQNVFFRHYPMDVLEMFYRLGCPIDAQEKTQSTPLALAAKYSDFEEVKFYVDHGANVNALNDRDETPLQFALKTFNWSVVKYLLDHGGSVFRSKRLDLPLVALAKIGWLNAIKYFLENKMYKNPSEVVRAFHTAAKYGQKQVIEFMLGFGVDVNALNPKGETALHAAFNGLFSGGVIETLLQNGAAVNARNRYGETLLFRAVQKRKLWAVKMLIRFGADVNAKLDMSIYKERPDWGIAQFDMDNPQEILDELKDIMRQSLKDQSRSAVEGKKLFYRGKELTPLLAAFVGRTPSLNIVKALMEGGANPNGTDEFGSTALHFATFNNGLDFVRYLLDRGAQESINRQNCVGDTPLIWAAQQGALESVMYLVEQGADISIRNSSRKTALEAAEETKNRQVAVYLRRLEGKQN